MIQIKTTFSRKKIASLSTHKSLEKKTGGCINIGKNSQCGEEAGFEPGKTQKADWYSLVKHSKKFSKGFMYNSGIALRFQDVYYP